MKKLSFLSFIMVITISLLSCESDSGDTNNNDNLLIVGKWIPTKIGTILDNGHEQLSEIPNAGKCESDLVEYSSDRSFSHLLYEFQNNKCISNTNKGTWLLKDKMLTAIQNGEDPNLLEVLELNESTLKLKQTLQTGSGLLVFISVYKRQ